ncbi:MULTISPECIES: M20 aminoacylase family protein [unclassified Xanthobacter]|uniref:M20 aminoacylase family protein n=1 Tax=unclassified Xanthobacter TaxID=2623496 RepID=UPI001EE0D08A|nr:MULTISPECIES: M20 aminoacylase family protein [unclassified Xanthobacter]
MEYQEVATWRRHLHTIPETAFEEVETSAFIARQLTALQIPFEAGIARTGVVATLKKGRSERAIGLRADIDALDITEANTFAHASQRAGKMHACGHDGHTAMLLGAARALARDGVFDGIVYLIFQPAEENEGGAAVAIEEGLFERFPMEAVFGLHNRPGLPIGTFGTCAGNAMASFDVFEIVVKGKGSHAARPQLAADPILAASQCINLLQSIVSRNVDPLLSLVVSVTQIHAGATWNVIPGEAVIRGTVRALDPATRDLGERRLREVAEHAARLHDCTAHITYSRRYPPLFNDPELTAFCAEVARGCVDAGHVHDIPPSLGSEDFAFMLERKRGAYIWIGNGPTDGDRILHNPHYEFNDAAIPHGIAYWTRLVETYLAPTP